MAQNEKRKKNNGKSELKNHSFATVALTFSRF
jgi:hypothetical protein